ncbi:MAG: flagellar assembly protein FliW [Chthoniobacterales bacterium]|nr:flagellar assembly protein FliW [Chthoniobacterales bacterium]MCX7713239.1 flagellar assembly protein FliW [Chthoniobacterales bacterium]
MQIETTQTSNSPKPNIEKAEVVLPQGLIGLKHLTHFKLITDESLYPFVVMRSLGEEEIDFVTVDARNAIPNYQLDISDADAAELGITSQEDDPVILNISIIHSADPPKVTSNLIAPVIINRKTGIGKQIVLENHHKYSTEYPLIIDKEKIEKIPDKDKSAC